MSRSRSRRRRSSGRRSPSTTNRDSASEPNDNPSNDDDRSNDSHDSGNTNGSTRARRRSTETKKATKTTELLVYVAAVIGVIMTALQVDESPNFGAERAWLYVTILTVGYMVSRGFAKAGSHEPFDK